MSKKSVSNLSNSFIEVTFEGKKRTYLLDNLLVDSSAEAVKQRLSRISADYAYWYNLFSEVNAKIRAVEAEYEYWYAEKYEKAEDGAAKKLTESYKKNKIILDNVKEWKTRLAKKSDLYLTRDKINGLLKSLDMQSRTLQTIAAMLRAEMDIIKTD